jgi:protein-disulfide isomerase
MKIQHILSLCGVFAAISIAPAMAQNSHQSTTPSAPGAPLQLNNIAPPAKIQFPPANPKNFTAASPTTQDVNAFLRELWGYDPNRIWQVDGIQSTKAPNVSQVTVLVAEQGVSHTPAATVFFVTPDGRHAIAGSQVIDFGPHPFAGVRAKLQQEATGPYRGSSSKNLMLVEFADLQCPHCKEAAGTMDHLVTDYPNARIVFQPFPLTNVHPAAEKAAEYGVCVAQQKGNAAFFQYVQAVYDSQAGLTTNADETLNAAATKAGANASQVSTCAAAPAAKAAVDSSVKLGQAIGVDQTPLLYVNGRAIPVAGVPYATLKQIIDYTQSEGASPAAAK